MKDTVLYLWVEEGAVEAVWVVWPMGVSSY